MKFYSYDYVLLIESSQQNWSHMNYCVVDICLVIVTGIFAFAFKAFKEVKRKQVP